MSACYDSPALRFIHSQWSSGTAELGRTFILVSAAEQVLDFEASGRPDLNRNGGITMDDFPVKYRPTQDACKEWFPPMLLVPYQAS